MMEEERKNGIKEGQNLTKERKKQRRYQINYEKQVVVYPGSSDCSLCHFSAAICCMTIDVVHGVSVKIRDVEVATHTERFILTVALEKHVLRWKTR